MIRYLLIFLFTIGAVGCASNSKDITISNRYLFNDIEGIEEIVQSGEFVALKSRGTSVLAITENHNLDLGLNGELHSNDFFDLLFQESEEINTNLGQVIEEFRIGLGVKNYIQKERVIKKGFTVYLWKIDNDKLVAIVKEAESDYFLNILGNSEFKKTIINIERKQENEAR